MDHQSAKITTESHSGVFSFVGYEYHQDSALVKPTQEGWLKPGFYPTPPVKTCFDCKMFDVSNWVASLNGENGPIGTTSHEALSVSSTTGQPPSLDRSHLCTPGLVTESCKRDERLTPSSQRPQYPTLYRRLKRRLGRSFRTKFYSRSVVTPGNRPLCLGTKGVSPYVLSGLGYQSSCLFFSRVFLSHGYQLHYFELIGGVWSC